MTETTKPNAGRASGDSRKGLSQGGKFFYGWWIVAGGLLIMATCYTVFVNCIPLFQSHMVEDLGITVGQFNTGVSICTVVAVFASLVIGRLTDKCSARALGAVTVLTSSVVLVAFSFITQLWQLYALCIIAGMVVVAGTRLLVSVLISNWFTLKRGLAVSIALSGSGLGGVILSPVTSAMIVGSGWRSAFLLLAVICLVFALPIAVIMFRSRPIDKGLEPYGAGVVEKEKADRSPDKPVSVSIGWRHLRKNAGFWMLIVGFVMMGIVNGAIITNSISNMTSVTLDGVEVVTGGHSTIWAGGVWSFYLAVVIFAKIALGAIYDRWGMKVGTILGTVASVLAGIALCFPATDWGPIIACLFFGFATCMGTVAPPIMVVKEYGKKDLGTVTGIVTAFEMFGAAVGAVVSGIMFDAFLSFVPVWIMVIVASALMGITLLASIPAARKLVERRIAEGAPELDAEGFEIASPSEQSKARA
ncbi:MFS transporter [Raoultibacter massiliensis]|uniref:MFS transporter n=1 Tax=Raoultibacter massiliensis TaxID=1852371 RepID=A0ABV1JFX8_9ACTN